MGLWTRSMMVLALLFGLLFAILMVATVALGLGVWFAIGATLFVVLLQFWLSPYIIDWILRIDWVAPESVSPSLAEFLHDLCIRRRVPVPQFGIIADGNPNAFTYGHFPSDARLVITQGIMDLLDEDEQKAVIAHEVGHIVHWDFVIMTIATAIPLVLYAIYRSLSRTAPRARRSGGYLMAVAIASYIAYIIAHYLVLFLSRTREYYSDEFSALSTRNPNALATALVKVAYGLACTTEAAEEAQTRLLPRLEGAKALGIFDPSIARAAALASVSASPTATVSSTSIVKAMQWDLWNPWAFVHELHSTHPLPAKRLKALEKLSRRLGQKPAFDFPERPLESYWDEFLIDLVTASLPYVGAMVGVAFGSILVPLGASWLAVIGSALLVGGSGYLAKVMFTHPRGQFPLKRVERLVSEVEVSGVRSVPCTVQGTLIGRGIPGLAISADLVLQDATGFIVLQYHQPLTLLEWLFGLFRVDGLVGRQGTAIGWYRRAPSPFIELLKVILDDGSEHRCYLYTAKLVMGGLAVIVGIVLLVIAFVI